MNSTGSKERHPFEENEIPMQIMQWIYDENRRLYYSGKKVQTWSQGAEHMYRHQIEEISTLRSENERLKGELGESAKLISTIVLDAVEYLHPDDVKKGREIILKHYPNPTT